MEIRDELAGEVLVLAPDGDLSTAEDCHVLEQRLSAAVGAGNRFVLVDCARVGHLTSPALRALLLASRKLARAKGRLVLCGMTPKVQKAFSISGFDRDFTVLPGREAALRVALEPLAAPAKAVARRPPGGAAVPPVAQGDGASVAPAAQRDGASVPPAAQRDGASVPPAAQRDGASVPPAAEDGGAGVPPVEQRRGAGVPPAAQGRDAGVPPVAPDPRLAVAARLIAALGGEADRPSAGGAAPAATAPARDALAAALMHAFEVHPD